MKFGKKSLLALCVITNMALAQNAAPPQKIPAPSEEEIMRFSMVYAQIKRFYVKDETDQKLFSDALHGMVAGLDPHSVYFDEEELKDFTSQAEGNFVGIGIEITTEGGLLKVVAPIDGSPAQKAGIKAGDYIVAVGNKPLVDVPITKAVKMLRGQPGSKVIISVISKADKKPHQITLVREQIHIDSVRSQLFDQKYGYIRISQFQSDTPKRVENAILQLQKQSNGKLAGIVLDLRNDPGGILDAAIDVSDAFLDSNKMGANKKIVYTKGRIPQAEETYNAKAGDLLHGLPIVVLINEGSASASEIVAGALQDQKRAMIVGQKSFGKGSVQTLLPISDKEAIKITTALYYTPNGRSIQAQGIEPDIVINEMQVQKNKNEASILNQLREVALDGHLANGNAKPVPIKATIIKTTTTTKKGSAPISAPLPTNQLPTNSDELATRDYQLYEALNILKTLTVLQKKS